MPACDKREINTQIMGQLLVPKGIWSIGRYVDVLLLLIVFAVIAIMDRNRFVNSFKRSRLFIRNKPSLTATNRFRLM